MQTKTGKIFWAGLIMAVMLLAVFTLEGQAARKVRKKRKRIHLGHLYIQQGKKKIKLTQGDLTFRTVLLMGPCTSIGSKETVGSSMRGSPLRSVEIDSVAPLDGGIRDDGKPEIDLDPLAGTIVEDESVLVLRNSVDPERTVPIIDVPQQQRVTASCRRQVDLRQVERARQVTGIRSVLVPVVIERSDRKGIQTTPWRLERQAVSLLEGFVRLWTCTPQSQICN